MNEQKLREMAEECDKKIGEIETGKAEGCGLGDIILPFIHRAYELGRQEAVVKESLTTEQFKEGAD